MSHPEPVAVAAESGTQVALSTREPATVTAALPAPQMPGKAVGSARQRGGRAVEAVRGAAGRTLLHGAYHLSRLGPAGIAGLSAIVATATIGLAAIAAVRHTSEQLSVQLAAASAPHLQPPTDALHSFIAAIPAREQMPAIISTLSAQAQAAGVSLTVGHYVYVAPTSGKLASYRIEFPLKAEYPKVRDFINRSLRSLPSATLERVQIERKVIGDPVVTADVRFTVFVTGGAEP
jgi:hypothetical protein